MANAIVKAQMSIVHMEISPISQLDRVWSPEVFIHGIPWKVEAYKDEEANSLAVHLQCTKEDNSSNWEVPACATVKLLQFGQKNDFLEHEIQPYISSPSSQLMQWDELLKNESKYVKNDKIEMKIEITAEDPNNVQRSVLKVENIDKSCDCGSQATFRLIVKNVENLLAVRSPRFILRGLPWILSIYKKQTSSLSIEVWNKSSEEVSSKIKMSIKLLSSNDDVHPIADSIEGQIESKHCLWIQDIISWEDLFKPQNGFVKNNSITLEVKIKVGSPDGDIPNIDAHHVAKRRRFECSICFEGLENQDMSTTPCGHLFWYIYTTCIGTALKSRKACPLCQKRVQLSGLRRLYPGAK